VGSAVSGATWLELIGARYERRSMLITANQPFADWNKVFPDSTMS
jgi:DNA replication protein DnaC